MSNNGSIPIVWAPADRVGYLPPFFEGLAGCYSPRVTACSKLVACRSSSEA
jgi:hypothetical protein